MDKMLIKPLIVIVESYLTNSYKNMKGMCDSEIFKYDPELMIPYLKYFVQCLLFDFNALHGNLNNMEWLLENKFSYDENTFTNAAENGNLENMKWLLKNKFPYNSKTIEHAIKNGNLDNLKWLLKNKFPYDTESKRELIQLGLLHEYSRSSGKGGGLLALVAMGAQDVYLSGNPKITYYDNKPKHYSKRNFTKIP